MDRFIVTEKVKSKVLEINLKSNMDRFIDVLHQLLVLYVFYLKSNMDRFIEHRQCHS